MKLQALDHQFGELLRTARSFGDLKVDLGAEDTELMDQLQTTTSPHQKVRKVQSKKLARKVYKSYHGDMGYDRLLPWLTFAQLRDFANAGELEILWFINAVHGKEDLSDDSVKKALSLIEVRISIMQASPGYKTAALYHANREAFIQRLMDALNAKILELQGRISNFYSQSGVPNDPDRVSS